MTSKTKTTLCMLLVAVLAAAASPVLAAGAQGKVNINDASAEQLALLPRVGPVVSQRIVDFREANGEFTSAEDLMLVAGIGERTFELIEPYIALDGETTLAEKVKAARSPKNGGSSD